MGTSYSGKLLAERGCLARSSQEVKRNIAGPQLESTAHFVEMVVFLDSISIIL